MRGKIGQSKPAPRTIMFRASGSVVSGWCSKAPIRGIAPAGFFSTAGKEPDRSHANGKPNRANVRGRAVQRLCTSTAKYVVV